MVGKLKSIDQRLFEPKCLQCGKHCGLGDGLARRCANCGCDFCERPPRSYAEMEGLIGQPVTIDSPMEPWRCEARFLQRWLAFIFVVMMSLMILLFLAGEVVNAM